MTFSVSWASPSNLRNALIDFVARTPRRVQTKLVVAFLAVVGLQLVIGIVALRALSRVNDETQQLIRLQREIAAFRQVQQDTTAQLYTISTALLFPEDRTLDAALRQLNQFGYDFDRVAFIAKQQAALIEKARQENRKLVEIATEVAALVGAGRIAEAREAQMTKSVPQADRLQRLLNQMVNVSEADMVAAIEATQRTYDLSRIVVIAFSVGSVLLALALGYVISWSLIRPVQAIESRLRGIAAGDFSQRVEVTNRDELGALADNVNQTSRELGRLYEEVQLRTRELARSVQELRALGEVSQAVNSTLDLETVLSTIVAKAVLLSETEAGAIYVYSRSRAVFRLRATYGMPDDMIEAIRGQTVRAGETPLGQAADARAPVQVPDLLDEPGYPVRDIILAAGFRAVLVVPLLGPGKVVGGLVVRRRQPGRFSEATVDLLETFAAQSVLAVQNARLFSELEEKSRQLEDASRHKSQFLANMSHELRTPLNSVLGFSEMLADEIYGKLPDKARAALEKVQSNGRHLLNLINDVLDLSKIEAGQMSLSMGEYRVGSIVHTAVTALETMARSKGIALTGTVPDGLPAGIGDERRLTQVLLNLVSNAVKFTDQGSVDVSACLVDGHFEIAVCDTGPGIALDDQERIFDEFQQVDSSSTRRKGGTGLGLAISRRFVEMHGGRIGVESAPGAGSTFRIFLPLRGAVERRAT